MPYLFHNYICSSAVKKNTHTNNSFQICPFFIKAPNLFFMLNTSKSSKICNIFRVILVMQAPLYAERKVGKGTLERFDLFIVRGQGKAQEFALKKKGNL